MPEVAPALTGLNERISQFLVSYLMSVTRFGTETAVTVTYHLLNSEMIVNIIANEKIYENER